jgi:hypothetical protein
MQITGYNNGLNPIKVRIYQAASNMLKDVIVKIFKQFERLLFRGSLPVFQESD